MSCDVEKSDRNSMDVEAVPYFETVIKFYHNAEVFEVITFVFSYFVIAYIGQFVYYISVENILEQPDQVIGRFNLRIIC
jgi:hypothetical protein